MSLRLRARLLLVLAGILGAVVAGQEIDAAQPSVDTWLKLIDTQQYTGSWESAAARFKDAIPQEKWTAAVAAVRGAVGPLQSRELKSVTHKTAPPGGPAGEYAVFQYTAVFEKNPAATELVVAVREMDGSWRIGGYSIK